MATVPSSGTLSMKSMAQEALHGTYGEGAIINPIYLYDMTNGGQVKGSGDDYPEINTDCQPNPIDRTYVRMPFVYQGETGRTPVFVEYTYYLDPSEAATTQDINNGDTIYTDAALTTPVGEWGGSPPYRRYNFLAEGGSAIGGSLCTHYDLSVVFQTNSSGQIINIECPSP